MRSLVVVAAVALTAGVVGGGGAGFFASRWLSAEAKMTDARGVATQHPAAGQLDARRSDAERRRLPPAVASVVAGSPAVPASVGPSLLEQLTPSERAQRWQQMYSGKIAAVEAESRDAAWATPTEQAFKQDFLAQSEAFQARLVDVDCRTTGCLARLEWSSYPLAKKLFRDVLHASFKVNCASTVDIGEAPERPNDPLQAVVVFECEEARIKQMAGG